MRWFQVRSRTSQRVSFEPQCQKTSPAAAGEGFELKMTLV